MDVVTEIEEALVGHWSHLGRWDRGALVEELGTLRYETPVAQLPYNGVLRTRISGDASAVVERVAASFAARGVSFLWWEHPTAAPAGLGALLERIGLQPVEEAVGMSLELAEWSGEPPAGVDYVPVTTDEQLAAYEDLTIRYWALGEEARALVSELSRFWRPGRAPVHRWLAVVDGRAVGKALLSLAAPPGVAAIYGMSVLPEARGRGVAAGLTSTLLLRARELGCRRVVLHSSSMAAGVYRRVGFVERCRLTAWADSPLWSGEHP